MLGRFAAARPAATRSRTWADRCAPRRTASPAGSAWPSCLGTLGSEMPVRWEAATQGPATWVPHRPPCPDPTAPAARPWPPDTAPPHQYTVRRFSARLLYAAACLG